MFFRHLALRLKQIRKDGLISFDNRIAWLEDIKLDGPIVRVYNCLYRVANVVDVLARYLVGGRVGILIRVGEAIHHPIKLSIPGYDDIRVIFK